MSELRREDLSYGIPPEDRERPLLEHITELIIRLRRMLIAVLVAAAILSFLPADTKYYIPLISYLPSRIIEHVIPDRVTWHGQVIPVRIAQYSPFGSINVLLETALLLGIIGASPVIAHEVYAYVEPALYPWEKRMLKRIAALAVGLFVTGVLLAFYWLLPVAFKIMIITSIAVGGPNMVIAFSDIQKLLSTILLIALASGIAFESPLIVYLLVLYDIVDPQWFEGENRKYVLFASYLLGAAVSPDPSGLGMIIVGTAVYLSIIAAAKLGAKHRRGKRVKAGEEPQPRAILEPALEP